MHDSYRTFADLYFSTTSQCRIHEATRRKHETRICWLLRKCLVRRILQSVSSHEQQEEPTRRVLVEMTTPSWQPLEQVVETDNETDATTTPGSSVFFSPPLSATSSQPQRGGTPVTPSLDNLHLRYVILVSLYHSTCIFINSDSLYICCIVPTRRQCCKKRRFTIHKKSLNGTMMSRVLLPNDTVWMPLKPGEHTRYSAWNKGGNVS